MANGMWRMMTPACKNERKVVNSIKKMSTMAMGTTSASRLDTRCWSRLSSVNPVAEAQPYVKVLSPEKAARRH